MYSGKKRWQFSIGKNSYNLNNAKAVFLYQHCIVKLCKTCMFKQHVNECESFYLTRYDDEKAFAGLQLD